jgi:serine/threonine protein kinase
VLDFGLAKLVHADPETDATPSGTLQSTEDGRILGTPGYMSPEQARGLPIDKRTDIWGFGCVLFEMLTGQRAFTGGFLTADGMMMCVIGFEGQEPGKAEPLFRTPLKPTATIDEYAVTGKGDRFLLIVPQPSRETARLNVMTNWAAFLRAQ